MRIVEAAIVAYYDEIDTEPPPPGARRLAESTIDAARPLLRRAWNQELVSERVLRVAARVLAAGEAKCPPVLRTVAAAVAEAPRPIEEAAAEVAKLFRNQMGAVPPTPGIDRLAQVVVETLVPITREQWEQDLVSERVVEAGEAALAKAQPPDVAAVLRAVASAVDGDGGGG